MNIRSETRSANRPSSGSVGIPKPLIASCKALDNSEFPPKGDDGSDGLFNSGWYENSGCVSLLC